MGTDPGSLPANTWTSTGYFYVHVTGKGGAYDLEHPFQLSVQTDASVCAPAGQPEVAPIGSAPALVGSTAQTVVAWDRPAIVGTDEEKATLATKLATLGTVINVADSPRIQQLRAQAEANPTCVYAQNLLASAIRDEIRAHANTNLKYVVLVGGDSSIPFFRYPDLVDLAPESWYVPPVRSNTPSDASLRAQYILGQDEYGSSTVLSSNGFTFPVPDLGVGRLVETAAEASNAIDAYAKLSGQALTPHSSLVTGYDFIADSAQAVKAEVEAGIGSGHTSDSLINSSWTADNLRSYLLDPARKYDLVYLAGHFDANSLLAADLKTTINATEVTDPGVNLENTLVWSTGCHAGYGVVDGDGIPGITQGLDWAQAMAEKGATLVAGTSFQYGDDALVEYSERIYAEFARQLRVGTGPVDVGSALVESKLAYLASTPDISNLHRKALISASLFGLPMFAVDMPGTRATTSLSSSIVTGTTNTNGVDYAGVDLTNLGIQRRDVDLDGDGITDATYYVGRDGTSSTPGEAVLPRYVANVTVPGRILRGVGFRGGAYTEENVVTPLVSAPGTESSGAQTPLTSTSFTPARIWSVSHFGELSGGTGTNLVVTPAQHRVQTSGDPTAIRRVYDDVDLRLFYAEPSDPVFALAPSVLAVSAVNDLGTVTFSMKVAGAPQAPVTSVWVTYTFGATEASPSWRSVDLAQSAQEPTLWFGTLLLDGRNPSALRYIVQAVNSAANVAWEDDGGPYYSLTGPTTSYPTSTTLSGANPSSGTHGSSASVSATFACSECTSLAGKSIAFSIGSTTVTGITNASGLTSASLPLNVLPGAYPLVATFAGDSEAAASTDSAPFTVNKIPTTVHLTLPATIVHPGLDSGVLARLTNASGPMPSRSVTFVIWDGQADGAGYAKAASTGADGTAALGALPALPNGEYRIYAYFGGSYAADPWSASPTTIAVDDPIFQASHDQTPPNPGLSVQRDAQTIAFGNLPASLTYGDPSFSVSATSTSGLQVTFVGIGGCSVSGQTVTITAAGDCTIRASVESNTTYDSATVDSAPISIALAASTTIVVCTAGPFTYTGSPIEPCTATATGVGGLSQSLTVSYANNTDAGTATATATYAGDTNHEASTGSVTFTIAKATSTTTVTCPTGVVYTGSALTPCSATVTGVSGLDQTLTVSHTSNTDAGTATASASYAGDANHTGSSATTAFTIAQAFIRAEYTGDWFVAAGTAPTLRANVYPAVGVDGVGPSQVDFSTDVVSAVFSIYPAGCGASCPTWLFQSSVSVANASDWAVTGAGTASVTGSTTLPDGGYVVTVELNVGGNLMGERAVAAVAIHPGTATYVSAGGYIREDSTANNPDNVKGYFGLNVRKQKTGAIGSVAYVYRLRIDTITSKSDNLLYCTTLSATCRDVDVLIRSTSISSASTTVASTWPVTGTATGKATAQFVDSVTGSTYNLAPTGLLFRYDAYDDAPGGLTDKFGFTVYRTTGKTVEPFHVAGTGPLEQTGAGTTTNQVLIGDGEISAPPGNR